ncbi:MAG: hypothetical protein KAQ96_08925, partial [Thermoplasmata archaeon]|nr:hypothetical protein [Thermoplasmata archaeon]
DTVEFMARLSYMGEAVDADPDWLRPYYNAHYNPFNSTHGDLPATRVSKGVYTFNYTVPVDVTESGPHTISCYGVHTRGSFQLDVTMDVELQVELFDAWVRLVSRDEKGAAIELHVVDPDGEAVTGAAVELKAYLCAGHWDDDTKWVNGTTDGAGRLFMNLTSDRLYLDLKYIRFVGNVTKGGFTQKVERYLHFRNPQREMAWDYDMLAEPLFTEPVPANTTVDLRYHAHAYFEGNPLENATVLVYIIEDDRIYYYGNHTTDAVGNFTVRITTPPLPFEDGWTVTSLTIYFQALVDGVWMVWRDGMEVGEKHPYQELRDLLDGEVDLSVHPMGVGRQVNITLDHPDADGVNETAWVYWGPGNPQMGWWWWHIPPPEWTIWDWTEIRQDVILAPCRWNGSAFVANITLPHFVPDHVPIYFASVIHFHNETDGWRKVVAREEDVLFVSTGGPPGIQMLSPIEGSTYGGTLLVHGTTR